MRNIQKKPVYRSNGFFKNTLTNKQRMVIIYQNVNNKLQKRNNVKNQECNHRV